MRAQYPSTCVACARHHIRVGDQIERRLGGYAARHCAERQDDLRALAARIAADMRRKEGIVLGHFGAEGCQVVTTRERYYRKANELGHCSLDEYTELQAYLSGLGLWCGAIDD